MLQLDLAPELADFRREVREFVRASLPQDIKARTRNGEYIPKADLQRWHRILAERGWRGTNWPTRYGGTGWSSLERLVFEEEYYLGYAPKPTAGAIGLMGPMLIQHGTEAQKQRFLPPILTSDEWWCQGFSEPGAGSDLAALKTTAVRDGDDYVLNGSKLWTSYAQDSEWMFLLARTSVEARKQAGISFFLMPMDALGVSVMPIITAGGLHEVNQVMLDDVRIPVTNLVGEEGQGWKIAGSLLGFERYIGANIGPSSALLRQARELAAQIAYEGHRLAEDRTFRRRLASLEIEFLALRATTYRLTSQEQPGQPPAPEVSVLMLKGAQFYQAATELLGDMCGPLALVDPLTLDDGAALPREQIFRSQQALDKRKQTIFGGTSEIQKNIIAKRILRVHSRQG